MHPRPPIRPRPRRLRQHPGMRRLVRETRLAADDLVAPFFVVPGDGVREPISSLPGQHHLSSDALVEAAGRAFEAGVPACILFGVPRPEDKDPRGSAAWDPEGPVPRAVRALREQVPGILVITDVCLCAYTDHGHCGLVEDGRVQNDPTLPLLADMALCHAQAGAHVVAPSDMMDGRVEVIRRRLDAEGLEETAILSYAAKQASAWYGPFREAAHSAPGFGDRSGYQMDPANSREARRELELDAAEGADLLLVKPAGPCLDILARARETCDLPLGAYQVSGEYAAILAAVERGWLERETIILESLLAIRRAGADFILTYFAEEAARLLGES